MKFSHAVLLGAVAGKYNKWENDKYCSSGDLKKYKSFKYDDSIVADTGETCLKFCTEEGTGLVTYEDNYCCNAFEMSMEPGTKTVFCEFYFKHDTQKWVQPSIYDPEHIKAMTFRRDDGVKKKYIGLGAILDWIGL